MIFWGVSSGFHDASLTVMQHDKILFASHSERFSKQKNDKFICPELVQYASQWGKPEKVFYYEKPWIKALRCKAIGQECSSAFPHNKSTTHHRSHAAAAYYTSGMDDSAVVVLDAIGEMECSSIWKGNGNSLKKILSWSYPHSLGLFYSAMTQYVGLKPNEEEYILMGMAALGNPSKYFTYLMDWFDGVNLKINLHRGARKFLPLFEEEEKFNWAAATQRVYEIKFEKMMRIARQYSRNISLAGGCALNCVANGIAKQYFDNVWVYPNPGDAGSSLGAILAHTNRHVDLHHLFLGYNIDKPYPTDEVIHELLNNKIVGVANGKAEFGPRALGHRSILADPRGQTIKDDVNRYKKREPFRPFSPMILAEHADDYFDIVIPSKFMSFVGKCKRPDLFPAIVHYDESSRIQVVDRSTPSIYHLLKEWYDKTGCPLLLNTSLNIKGKPLVNDEQDVMNFEKTTGLKVCV